MAVEAFANDISTLVNGAIGSATSPIVVSSAAGFPTSGQFRIRIESELLLVTAMGGTGSTSWTVTRGIESSVAASHPDGATVTHVLTAGSLAQFRADAHASDTYANRPAAGLAGRLYLPTDAGALYRDDGAAWTPFGPLNKLVQPDDSSFSWINQGSSTVTTGQGRTYLSVPTSGTFAARGRVKSIPASPYTLTVRLDFLFLNIQYHQGGLVLRDSASDKLITFEHLSEASVMKLRVTQWNNSTTPTTAVFVNLTAQLYRWWRIQDDGTNRLYSVSMDGLNWMQWYSEARTTFITPNQCGYFILNEASGNQAGLVISSWQEA